MSMRLSLCPHGSPMAHYLEAGPAGARLPVVVAGLGRGPKPKAILAVVRATGIPSGRRFSLTAPSRRPSTISTDFPRRASTSCTTTRPRRNLALAQTRGPIG